MIRRSFKNIISLFVLLMAGALSLSAQQVTREDALSKAEQFFNRSDVVSRRAVRKAPQLTLANDRSEFYVFNDEANGGYIIISGDERMPEVLGYSYDGHFDAEHIPCNMQALMENFACQVDYLRTHPEAIVTKRRSPDRENIAPMLTCSFGQGYPYNNKCPEADGEHSVTGCVAVAMAEIMHYHQWPKQTTQIIPGYTTFTQGFELPDIPITTIDWDNILGHYDSDNYNYSDEQIDAISTLMLLCGASAKMEYTTTSGSGAAMQDAANAFRKYFDYEDLLELIYRDAYDDEWEQVIYDELKRGRPVLYAASWDSGESHAFVVHGYENGYFRHGSFWVLLNDNFGLKYHQHAIVGIKPANGDAPSEHAVLDNGKMTLYYDKEKVNRTGTILPHRDKWSDYADFITECVIDPSFANVQLYNLREYFSKLSKLKAIGGIENLNTSMVSDMSDMFSGCSSLTSLDLSSFKTDKTLYMHMMFYGCSDLTTIYASERWNMSNVQTSDKMFEGCSNIIGGAGTPYDANHTGADYAHIDGGPDNPGYFTNKAPPIIMGDANGDGLVNVTDIVATVNFVMEKNPANFNKAAADLTGDGEINVTDIVKMVSIIMASEARRME